MKYIILFTGQKVKVDDDNFELLNIFKWSYSGRYAQRVKRVEKKYECILMHRFIMNAQKSQIIDHIDSDKLNNQKNNLRFCTSQQNKLFDYKKRNNCTSKYFGVSFSKGNYKNKWQAQICCNGKHKHLGYFKDEIEAAKIYNKFSKKYFGKDALLNKF